MRIWQRCDLCRRRWAYVVRPSWARFGLAQYHHKRLYGHDPIYRNGMDQVG